jgi:hypothetical protein
MRSIIEYSAVVIAGWLSFNVLFAIAWARFHEARRQYEDRKVPFIVSRRDVGVRSESDLTLSFKKTS